MSEKGDDQEQQQQVVDFLQGTELPTKKKKRKILHDKIIKKKQAKYMKKDFESDDEEGEKKDGEEVEAVEPEKKEAEPVKPKPAKKKKEYESMAAAFTHVLKKEVKQNDPIMAANKTVMKKLDAKRVANKEEKWKKLKKMERMYREYVVPEEETNEYEKSLKTIATKGVVKLFNAVKTHQAQLQKPKKAAAEGSSLMAQLAQ